MRSFIICSVLSYFMALTLSAQYKFEKEYSLDEKEVPQQALDFVKSMGFDSKIKWYHEEAYQSNSIEAKTKYKGKKYSIEFDESGALEDIEIEVKWRKIEKKIRNNIQEYLKANFRKYDIEKIQMQYPANAKNLEQLRALPSQPLPSGINYELVVKAKKNSSYDMYEMLFDDMGDFQTQSIFILKNNDNLEY